MLMRLLPDRTMPALALAHRRGVYHQLAQLLMPGPGKVVQIQKSVMDVIPYLVHKLRKNREFRRQYQPGDLRFA